MNKICSKWGGCRFSSGRKKTCTKKISYNRRINSDIINILKDYAFRHNLTETQALENAILLQTNIEKQKGNQIMKIAIPTLDNKLCSHFGHCETFTFVDVNPETKEILNIKTALPEDGISCQSANWIASQGANFVLAGGMGERPLMLFAQNGVQVILGCPELEIKDIVTKFLDQKIQSGINSCGTDHQHHCHGGHGEAHHGCGGK